MQISTKDKPRHSKNTNDNVSILQDPEEIYSIKLEYDSPRLQSAMLKLGMVAEEIKPISKKKFIHTKSLTEKDPKLLNKKYQHYKQRTMMNINAVIQTRKS